MNVAPRFAFSVCAIFIVAFQIRFSLATLEARSTFLYVPFQLKPCTNTIESRGQSSIGFINRGDTLLAVNGRPFTGMAVYRQELRSARRRLDATDGPENATLRAESLAWPFRVTVRTGAAEPRTFDVYFANCTCGSLDPSEVVWYCIVPPAVCVALGLIVAACRLHSPTAWLFLAVMVCLSAVTFVPDWSDQWSQVADPREWRHWFRIPALAYQAFFIASRPAWLLLLAVHLSTGNSGRRYPLVAWWAVSPVLLLALLKTVVAVGSSEYFPAVAPLQTALQSSATEVSVITFFSLAAALQAFGKRWVFASVVCAVSAAIVLYWPAQITNLRPEQMCDDAIYYRTPTVVSACFSAVLLLMVAIASCRQSFAARNQMAVGTKESWTGLLATTASLLLLLVPFLYPALSSIGYLWWMPFGLQGILASLFVGAAASAWAVLSRARPTNPPLANDAPGVL